jgi:hypothetical protein
MADVITDVNRNEVPVPSNFESQKLGVVIEFSKLSSLSPKTRNLFENAYAVQCSEPQKGPWKVLNTDAFPRSIASQTFLSKTGDNDTDPRVSLEELKPLFIDSDKAKIYSGSNVDDFGKNIISSKSGYWDWDKAVFVLKEYPMVGVEIAVVNDTHHSLGTVNSPPSADTLLNAPGGKIFQMVLKEVRPIDHSQ